MGILLDATRDFVYRAGGPASTGLTAATYWTWHRRLSTTYTLTQNAIIMTQQGNADRHNAIGFDNTFVSDLPGDPRLKLTDANGRTLFAVGEDHPTFGVWYFYVFILSGTAGSVSQIGYYSALGSSTWFTQTRPSLTEGSIVPAYVLLGQKLQAGADNCSQGDYAYAGCRAEVMTEANAKALKTRSATAAGDWAYWELPNAATLTDSSGNGRTMTANGTVTDGATPTFPSASMCNPLSGRGGSAAQPLRV